LKARWDLGKRKISLILYSPGDINGLGLSEELVPCCQR